MKKILFNIVLMLLLCPILIGAFVTQISFATPIVSGSKGANNIIPAESNKTLNLSTQNFGLCGPLSLGAQYSQNDGYFLQGQYVQGIGADDAVALGLDFGRKLWRLNGTWGHAITPDQRVKLTLEHLAQNMAFDFLSGNKDEWVSQNAYGLTYEYLLHNSWLNDVNVNLFYSKADSKNLDDKLFTESETQYLNLRRIAGATDKSVSLGVDLLPVPNSLINVQLNYDNVHYDTHYIKNPDTAGIGATVSLSQLLTRRVKFQLTGMNRKPYDQYQAELDYLLQSAPGTRLEMSLVGAILTGKNHLADDNSIGLNLNYTWGGNTRQLTQAYTFTKQNSFADLTHWTAKPAVYMPEVLAIKDETKKAVAQSESSGASTVNQAETKIIRVKPDESINIDLAKVFPQSDSDVVHYEVKNLPEKLRVNDQHIIGKFNKSDNEHQFSVNVLAHGSKNSIVVPTLLLVFSVTDASPNAPYPNPDYAYKPDPTGRVITVPVGQSFSETFNNVSDNRLFIDPDYPDTRHPMTLRVDGLEGTGLTAEYFYNKEKTIPYVTIKGSNPTREGFYPMTITAINKFGESDPQRYTIKIGQPTPGVHIVVLVNPVVTKDDTLNAVEIAAISTDSGTIQPNQVHINPVNPGAGDESLSHFGISYQIPNPVTKAHPQQLALSADHVLDKTFKTQHYVISVDGYSKTATFTFDSRGAPRVTDANLGSRTVVSGGSFDDNVDLSAHFENTTPKTDTMNYEVNRATTSSGFDGTIVNGRLTHITVPSVTPGTYHVTVHAENNAAKAQGFSSDAMYTITVQSSRTVTLTCPTEVDPASIIDPETCKGAFAKSMDSNGIEYLFNLGQTSAICDKHETLHFMKATIVDSEHRLSCQYESPRPHVLYTEPFPLEKTYIAGTLKFVGHETSETVCHGSNVNDCRIEYQLTS